MEIFFKLLFSLLLFYVYHFHKMKYNLQSLQFWANVKLKWKHFVELWH